jgi:hypothetical protein
MFELINMVADVLNAYLLIQQLFFFVDIFDYLTRRSSFLGRLRRAKLLGKQL